MPDLHAECRGAKSSRISPPVSFGMAIGKGDDSAVVMMSGREMEKLIRSFWRQQHNERGCAQVLRRQVLKGKCVRWIGDVRGLVKDPIPSREVGIHRTGRAEVHVQRIAA